MGRSHLTAALLALLLHTIATIALAAPGDVASPVLQKSRATVGTAAAFNIKDYGNGAICSGTEDARSTLQSLVSGPASGARVFIPSGCMLLLSTPGAGNVAIDLPSNTILQCENATAGFTLARHSCSGGDTPGGACDGTGADCPGGGTCVYDVGSSEFASSPSGTYTVIGATSGGGQQILGCQIWAQQRSMNPTSLGGDGSNYGYCSGGTLDTAVCRSLCTGGAAPGKLCNADADCPGGGTCANKAHCADGGGTCGSWSYTQAGGASGAGKIRAVDFDGASHTAVRDVTVWDIRTGDYGVRIGKGGAGDNIHIAYATDPNVVTSLFLLPNAALDVGINVKPDGVIRNSEAYGWTAAYRLVGGIGANLFGATVNTSVARSLGVKTETTWPGTVGFLFNGAGNYAVENHCDGTFICGGCEYGTAVNSAHFLDNLADGLLGPLWQVCGSHNDVRGNRRAWSGLGALITLGETRGRCSGGSRSGQICLQNAGVDATIGCPGSSCDGSSDFKDTATLGHFQISNNLLASEKSSGIGAYLAVAQSKRCTAGNSGASVGNPCTSANDCGAGGVCGALSISPGMITDNFFYTVPSTASCMDFSSPALDASGKPGLGLSRVAITGNFCQMAGSTGIVFPSTSTQSTELRVSGNSFTGAAPSYANWSSSMGSLQFPGSMDTDNQSGSIALGSAGVDFTLARLADYDNTYSKTMLNGCATFTNGATGDHTYVVALQLEGATVQAASTMQQGNGAPTTVCLTYLDATSAPARTATLVGRSNNGTADTATNRVLTRVTLPAS